MELEDRMFKVYAKGDEKIQLKIIPDILLRPSPISVIIWK